jgi:hypothetical protein
MPKDWTIAEVSKIPNCDLCKKMGRGENPASYDGAIRTNGNPWAFMCEECWTLFGTGKLGLGLGQRLVLEKK